MATTGEKVLATAVGVALVAGVGAILARSTDSLPFPDPEEAEVVFDAFWGQINETGELYEDTGKPVQVLECEPRELEVTAWVNGEGRLLHWEDSVVDEDCHSQWEMTVPKGSELRMTIAELGDSGWKLCTINVNGHLALPNGFAIQPGPETCDAWGIAF